jgi:hypothetical protein
MYQDVTVTNSLLLSPWLPVPQDHFDLSVWAFQKLTDMKWGVIPIQYRQVRGRGMTNMTVLASDNDGWAGNRETTKTPMNLPAYIR